MIGRLTRDPEFQKYEGKSKCRICIAVKRPFKNSDGIFEVDYITWNVWNVIAEKVNEYVKKGDLISVKGRVQNNDYKDKSDNKVYSYEFVAESVSFLQSEKREPEVTTVD